MEPQPPTTPELPPPQPLPIISEDTKNKLLEELGLDTDLRTNQIIQSITGKPLELSSELIRASAESTFFDLITANRGIVAGIDEELSKVDLNPNKHNAFTNGMAIVLRAFQLNSDFGLIPRFVKLEPEDTQLVGTIIQKIITLESSQLPNLTRLLKLPRIPEQQIALNEIIGKTTSFSSLGGVYVQQTRDGASAMYQILGHLWPKLYPPNQTIAPQPPPPVL